MKQCRKCKEWKERSEFNKDKNRDDGFYVYCKLCHRADSKRYQDGNKEIVAKRAKAAREQNKDAIAIKSHRKYIANPEPRKARERARYQEKKEELRPYYREHYQTHKENWPIGKSYRRAKRLGCEGIFTLEEWKALCLQCDHKCVCCKQSRKLTIDHVVPLTLGGSNYIENIQPLCKSCNSRKGSQTIDYRDALLHTGAACDPREPQWHLYMQAHNA